MQSREGAKTAKENKGIAARYHQASRSIVSSAENEVLPFFAELCVLCAFAVNVFMEFSQRRLSWARSRTAPLAAEVAIRP
jgi:hypothetical protein